MAQETKLKVGVFHNVTIGDYLKIPAVSPSAWQSSKMSMLHCRHHMENEIEATDAMRLGSATHCAVFEPGCFDTRYIVWQGGRRAGKEWESFEIAAGVAGREILTTDQYARCIAMRESIRSHPAARKLITPGAPSEVTLVWRDKASGEWCKSRPDTYGTRLVDLKSSARIDEWSLCNVVSRYGYHVSLAAKHDGLNQIEKRRLDCALIFIESVPPHDCVVRRLPDEVLEEGLHEWRDLLKRIAECRASGIWPGICAEELTITLPQFRIGAGVIEDEVVLASA